MEIPDSFYELYIIDLGGTVFIIGLIAFIEKICFASVQFPGGYLADRFGRRWIIISMTFGLGLTYLIFALAPDWKTLLIGKILYSLLRISNPALQSITADSLPSNKRGIGWAIYQLTIDLTSTPAPLVAGLIFARFGFVSGMRIAYFLVSLSYIASALIRLRLKETVENVEKITLKKFVLLFPASVKDGIAMLPNISASLKALVISDNIFFLALSMIMPYIIVYATLDLELSKFQWSIILAIQFLATSILTIPIGKMIDVFGGKKIVILSNFLLSIIFVVLIYGNYIVLLFVMPLFGISLSASRSAFRKLFTDFTQRKIRGRMSGITKFLNLMIGATGNILGGYIYQNIDHKFTYVMSLIITCIGIIFFNFHIKELQVEKL